MDNWRGSLGGFFREEEAKQQKESSDLTTFINNVVLPAFDQLAEELRRHGRSVTTRSSATTATLIVQREGEEEMRYRIQGRMFPNGVLPFADIRCKERKGRKFVTVESMFRSGSSDYTLSDITSDEVIENFVENYTRRIDTD